MKKFSEDEAFSYFIENLLNNSVTDKQVKASLKNLKSEIKPFNPYKISQMTPAQLRKILLKKPGHRRYKSLSENIILAAKKILKEYNGDCRKIWEGNRDINEVIKRLREFRGIGQKISNDFTDILLRNHGIELEGLEKLDVPADRHVVRVFFRTGLVEKEDSRLVVKRARELNPKCPADLDITYDIGKKFCHERKPDCKECPLYEECPKNF
ncbi:MAG: endonuclease III domain-containing protein [Candidatus Hydrothermarchaeota archaeon]